MQERNIFSSIESLLHVPRQQNGHCARFCVIRVYGTFWEETQFHWLQFLLIREATLLTLMKPSLDLLTREAALCHHDLVAFQLIQSHTCTFEPEAGRLYFPLNLAKRQSHKPANMDKIQYSTFGVRRKSSIPQSFSSISTQLYKEIRRSMDPEGNE